MAAAKGRRGPAGQGVAALRAQAQARRIGAVFQQRVADADAEAKSAWRTPAKQAASPARRRGSGGASPGRVRSGRVGGGSGEESAALASVPSARPLQDRLQVCADTLGKLATIDQTSGPTLTMVSDEVSKLQRLWASWEARATGQIRQLKAAAGSERYRVRQAEDARGAAETRAAAADATVARLETAVRAANDRAEEQAQAADRALAEEHRRGAELQGLLEEYEALVTQREDEVVHLGRLLQAVWEGAVSPRDLPKHVDFSVLQQMSLGLTQAVRKAAPTPRNGAATPAGAPAPSPLKGGVVHLTARGSVAASNLNPLDASDWGITLSARSEKKAPVGVPKLRLSNLVVVAKPLRAPAGAPPAPQPAQTPGAMPAEYLSDTEYDSDASDGDGSAMPSARTFDHGAEARALAAAPDQAGPALDKEQLLLPRNAPPLTAIREHDTCGEGALDDDASPPIPPPAGLGDTPESTRDSCAAPGGARAARRCADGSSGVGVAESDAHPLMGSVRLGSPVLPAAPGCAGPPTERKLERSFAAAPEMTDLEGSVMGQVAASGGLVVRGSAPSPPFPRRSSAGMTEGAASCSPGVSGATGVSPVRASDSVVSGRSGARSAAGSGARSHRSAVGARGRA
ncbi:unnamed protein product [Pedinophyceae sp. YPF-701]|nr:unnamed protein product [Pedinophyceae sp. YPF-701]